jgi:hypothetical protein
VVLRLAAIVMMMLTLVAACGDGEQLADSGGVAAEQTTTTSASSDEVRSEVFGEGSWQGVRTMADPTKLVVAVVGAAAYEPGNPCTADYAAFPIETAKEVRLRFTSRSPSWSTAPGVTGCDDIGYSRLIEVQLREPLGERKLVEAQFGREHPVFDGSSLFEPTWLPDGMKLVSEQPGYPEPETARYWQRTWAEEREADADGNCVGTRPPVMVTQGPADLLERHPATGLKEREPGTVRGVPATYASNDEGDMSDLRWVEDGTGIVLTSFRSCDRDTAMPHSTLVRIAESLAR